MYFNYLYNFIYYCDIVFHYRNKHQNCCRLKHRDTGIIKTGQSHRDRPHNQKEALHAMAADPRFLAYCERRLSEIENGETAEQWVDRMMCPQNLIIQTKDENGNWREE